MPGRKQWPAFELVVRINHVLIQITVSLKAVPVILLLGSFGYAAATGATPGV